MTTQPVGNLGWPQTHLLTVAEYLALGETEPGYTELVEGLLSQVPGPEFDHNYAGDSLCFALRQQIPPHLLAVTDMDVDLQLAPPDAPGTVRRPDVVVVHRAARERIRSGGGIVRAPDVVVAVETISPGSGRRDCFVKRDEYADAGIPHYWILDLTEPVSLLIYHLAGELGYADGREFTGTFATTEPFAFELDLDTLR
ncbi:MAG: Uma2 family endonuclease [Pseudonocardia sp.]